MGGFTIHFLKNVCIWWIWDLERPYEVIHFLKNVCILLINDKANRGLSTLKKKYTYFS